MRPATNVLPLALVIMNSPVQSQIVIFLNLLSQHDTQYLTFQFLLIKFVQNCVALRSMRYYCHVYSGKYTLTLLTKALIKTFGNSVGVMHIVCRFQTTEMTLRRNDVGQLGFHIHYDGIVSDVEPYGFAWKAGLQQGSRLVEICKVATATLSHDQMIDLLRTSVPVTVVVIPPFEDGTPRR